MFSFLIYTRPTLYYVDVISVQAFSTNMSRYGM